MAGVALVQVSQLVAGEIRTVMGSVRLTLVHLSPFPPYVWKHSTQEPYRGEWEQLPIKQKVWEVFRDGHSTEVTNYKEGDA